MVVQLVPCLCKVCSWIVGVGYYCIAGGESGREKQLDFGAVQRGDAEMEQKLHRVIRACVECSSQMNPILSIHDQGAGGNGNHLANYR